MTMPDARNRVSDKPPPAAPAPTKPSFGTLLLGGGLSLLLLLGMTALDRRLRTPAAPSGIISFELAGTWTAAARILASWDSTARIQAGISLGLDFSFLAAYAFTLAGAARKVAVPLGAMYGWLGATGRLLAGCAWLAAGLDAVENLALIQLLIGPGAAWQPALAAGCAWPKFALTACVLVYIFSGGTVLGLQRWGLWKRS
jgi:hypothetical protein